VDYTTLRINFEIPDPDAGNSDDWLKIVQPEWGKPPEGGFLGWINQNNYKLTIDRLGFYYRTYMHKCEDDGTLEVELQVHKSRVDLEYKFSCSYGELSDRVLDQTAEHKKSIVVEMKDSVDLEAEIQPGFSATWEGPVYDLMAEEMVVKPEITATGSILSFGQKVAGVLRLNYTEAHDTYYLTLTPREDEEIEDGDQASGYQSTAMAVWAGNVVTHDIDLPDMTGGCSGVGVHVNPDDPESEKCYDLYVVRHKCTGEIISEDLQQVPCPEDGGVE